jgi:hypothetical protein
MPPRRLEKKITLGFKIMSGFYLGALARSDVSRLTDASGLPWGTLDLETKLNAMGEELLVNKVFKYWSSWGTSILDATSDAIAVNFLLVMWKDWDRKGRPTNPNALVHKQFQKNATILLDRSIYEYITRKWRGSSDSRIAANLKAIESANELFDPIRAADWTALIDDVVDKGKIEGLPYGPGVDNRIRLLLYYYYVLKEIGGPNDPTVIGIDVDHIIPDSLFGSTLETDLKVLSANIANLGLLPRRQNISKGAKRLNELRDPWLIDQVERYEEIPESDFAKFSDVSQIRDLMDSRGPLIQQAFKETRKRLISY